MMTSASNNWGGTRCGAGRKPDATQKIAIKIRLTEEQHEKLRALGGSQWIAKQIDEAKMISNEIKEAIKEALYSCFDGFNNEEVIQGCAAEALVDGFYTKTEATDNKLSEGASEKEIESLIDDLVEDAMTRIIEVEDNGELPSTQYFRKYRI